MRNTCSGGGRAPQNSALPEEQVFLRAVGKMAQEHSKDAFPAGTTLFLEGWSPGMPSLLFAVD